MDTWIVLVEASTTTPGQPLDPASVEALLTFFEDETPVGLYAPDRYALQVWSAAPRAEQAITDVIGRWRAAASESGLGSCQLVRAEVMTPAELHAELQSGGSRLCQPTAYERLDAIEAVQEATKSLLRTRGPQEVTKVVVALVHRLGGSIVVADGNHPYRLPFDLSFGEGRALSPAAAPYTTARQLLQEHVPGVVEDAWHVLRSQGPDGPRPERRFIRQTADVEFVRDRTVGADRAGARKPGAEDGARFRSPFHLM